MLTAFAGVDSHRSALGESRRRDRAAEFEPGVVVAPEVDPAVEARQRRLVRPRDARSGFVLCAAIWSSVTSIHDVTSPDPVGPAAGAVVGASAATVAAARTIRISFILSGQPTSM